MTYSIIYHKDGDSKIIQQGIKGLDDAKKNLIRKQLQPTSFFKENPEHKIYENHHVTIQDHDGRTVYGDNGECKLTTISAIDENRVEKIPDHHIVAYVAGADENENINKTKGTIGKDYLVHMDKREFEVLVNNILSISKMEEYSKAKITKTQCILSSHFYNVMRDGIEDKMTETIEDVILDHLGSEHISDKMFEDTQRSLLPHIMMSHHLKTIEGLHFSSHTVKEDLEKVIDSIERQEESIKNSPPPFFSDEWDKEFAEAVRRIVDRMDDPEPIDFKPKGSPAPKRREVASQNTPKKP